MCIRDSFDADGEPAKVPADAEELRVRRFRKPGERGACEVCLLYTSDAADERSSVDLGGRRIIKKKKKEEQDGRRHDT